MEQIPSTYLAPKLWIYTNYDCNLSCPYCCAESTPRAARRPIGTQIIQRLVDEALPLGFNHVYFTGGEPFLLDEIYDMLIYASQQVTTTVLTNAMLLRGSRLERLRAIHNDNLIVQVSLDGAAPEQHDPWRGAGSWTKTVEGIHRLQDHGFRVRLATTQTPANADHTDEICAFHLSEGIPEEDHFIRVLARRGFSPQGIEVSRECLAPEITVSRDGVFWHPLTTDADMLVSEQIFPLADAVCAVKDQLEAMDLAGAKKFK